MKDTVRKAGNAIVSTHSIRKAKSLPSNTAAQKDDLIVLT